MNPALLIRADASSKTGTGHVMRCLALAHAAQASSSVVFACAELPEALEARLNDAGCVVHRLNATPGSLEDANTTAQLAQRFEVECVVLDGYQFDEAFEAQLKSHIGPSVAILAFDDEGLQPHANTNLILNQNHGTEHFTAYSSNAKHLLGSRFALLRPEFLVWQNWQRPIPERISRILVTFGGSDSGNHSLDMLRALESCAWRLELRVLVGAANPHLQSLREHAASSSHQIELCQNVTDMPAMLTWAEFAVSAAGSTVWELAFMNLPAAIVVVAQNQTVIANAMDGVAGMRNFGWINDLNPHELETMLQDAMARAYAHPFSGRNLIDGFGAQRVLAHLEKDPFWLRPATPSDARQVWLWANDPSVRAVSFNSDPILWESHQSWFANKLKDPQSVVWMVIGLEPPIQDQPVGLVRFDLGSDQAVISVVLDAQARGQGLGSAMIARASQRLWRSHQVSNILAYVKTDNPRSLRAFLKAGYADAVDVSTKGSPAWCLRFSSGEA